MSRNKERRKPARRPKRITYDGAQVVLTAVARGPVPQPSAPVFGRPLFGYDHPGTL